MSGAFAKTHRTIWRDPDFRELTIGAQWLYWHLFSSPKLTWCGVLDWKPRATVKAAQDATGDRLGDYLHELRRHRFVVVDESTDELIVRSFVRSDSVHKQPKLMSALATAFAGIESDLIAGVLSWELQRLKSEEPNLSGWDEVKKVLQTPPCKPSEIPIPERVSPGVSEKGTAKGMAKGCADNYTSPTPTPTPQHMRDDIAGDDVAPIDDSEEFALIPPEDAGPSLADKFDQFYEAYPRKRDRVKALEAFEKAVKQKRMDPDQLIQAAHSLANDPNLPGATVIPYAATWLNGERWNDPPYEPRHHMNQTASERRMNTIRDIVTSRMPPDQRGQIAP